MSFSPEIITPEYAELKTRIDHSHIRPLQFPRDRQGIARLSLAEKQIWYAAQDPHSHIEAGDEFSSFWYWHYIVPLKLKRTAFRLKFW